MRIPKLSKSSDSEHNKSESDNLSCLFCSHPVKNANLARYENHLVQRHNLEKHIQQTILDTFNGQKRSLEKKNEELFSMKCVKDAMESIEKINKEKSKGTFRKTSKDKGVDPFKDLLDFVEKSEKDIKVDRIFVENVRNIEIKSEKSFSIDTTENIEEETQQPAEPTQYKCEECDKSYDRAAKLNFHLKRVHTETAKNNMQEEKDDGSKGQQGDSEGKTDDLDWADYLIFDCKVCLTKMPSVMYPDHLLTWHSLSLADYQQKTGDSGSCTPAEYQCLVCIGKIPWNRSSLSEHLAAHKLTLDQYKVIFEKAIKKQVDKQTELIKKGKTESLPEMAKSKSPEKVVEQGIKDITEKENKVECKICQKKFSTNFKLQRHMKTDHCDTSTASSVKANKTEQTLLKDVKTEIIAPETMDKKFKCQICKEEMMWTDLKIKDHLSQKHCLTKEFYFTLYETSSGKKSDDKPKESSSDDKFSCKECIFSSSRKMALTGHVKKYHDPAEEVTCCKERLGTKWAVFVHLMENHKDKNKELFAKFQVWSGLEKYYVPK